jgi:prephenate dehydrogenase
MAGSEQAGLSGARAELFVGATWALTPTSATTPERYSVLVGAIRALGATSLALTAADHDRLVAMVSHVPHLVAGAMMNEASLLAESDAALLRLAAGGFRDMTRVAAGHPAIWPDVCIDNRDAILAGLASLRGRLATLEAAIAGKDRSTILSELTSASAARRNLPTSTPDPAELAQLRVPVPDRPGVLAEITTAASDANLNIYDLEIAHSAEGSSGVLIMVLDAAAAPVLAAELEARGLRTSVEAL